MRPVQAEVPKATPDDKMKLSQRLTQILGLVGLGLYTPAGQTSRPGWHGRATQPRIGKGRSRGVIVPCTMHVEKFATAEERNDRFRALRASRTARDVTKGYDVDKWYVAWNGKAA